jgi:hypothetical protein
MSIAQHRGYSLKDSPAAYRQALDRVSGRPSTIEGFAHWLLSFSVTSNASFSAKNWKDFQWEGFVFAYPDGFPTMDGEAIRSLPSKTDLIQMQNWAGSLWKHLEKGERVYIESNRWLAELHAEHDRIVGFASPRMSSWSESFKFEAFQVLTAKDLDGRFRFCKREKCRRPFLSIKRQTFCSISCSQHHRTSLYRTKNREQFREKRREYYKKKTRERTGLPNLRIQTSKGGRP